MSGLLLHARMHHRGSKQCLLVCCKSHSYVLGPRFRSNVVKPKRFRQSVPARTGTRSRNLLPASHIAHSDPTRACRSLKCLQNRLGRQNAWSSHQLSVDPDNTRAVQDNAIGSIPEGAACPQPQSAVQKLASGKSSWRSTKTEWVARMACQKISQSFRHRIRT